MNLRKEAESAWATDRRQATLGRRGHRQAGLALRAAAGKLVPHMCGAVRGKRCLPELRSMRQANKGGPKGQPLQTAFQVAKLGSNLCRRLVPLTVDQVEASRELGMTVRGLIAEEVIKVAGPDCFCISAVGLSFTEAEDGKGSKSIPMPAHFVRAKTSAGSWEA